MPEENKNFTIKKDDSQRRADRVIRKFLPGLPLSCIYSAMRKGLILINGKKIKPSYLTVEGDILELRENLTIIPENKKNALTDLPKPDVLVKTRELIFINKNQGCTVHGKNSLTEAVLAHFPASSESLSFTPGPLHRLDKDTTGIITFSQTLSGAKKFSKALQNGDIGKYYLGVIEGTSLRPVLKNLINGKECICHSKVLSTSKKHNLSLVRFNLITGKKHQIRIQCSLLKRPLLNDKKYGAMQNLTGTRKYFLHAYKLELEKAFLNDGPREIIAPIPAKFKKLIKDIFSLDLKNLAAI